MKKAVVLFALLVGCGAPPPRKTEVTCHNSRSRCYIVQCDKRTAAECESFFNKFCPNGWTDNPYSPVTPEMRDMYLECKE